MYNLLEVLCSLTIETSRVQQALSSESWEEDDRGTFFGIAVELLLCSMEHWNIQRATGTFSSQSWQEDEQVL